MAKQRQGTLELKFIFLLLAIIFCDISSVSHVDDCHPVPQQRPGNDHKFFMEKFLQSPGLEKR